MLTIRKLLLSRNGRYKLFARGFSFLIRSAFQVRGKHKQSVSPYKSFSHLSNLSNFKMVCFIPGFAQKLEYGADFPFLARCGLAGPRVQGSSSSRLFATAVLIFLLGICRLTRRQRQQQLPRRSLTHLPRPFAWVPSFVRARRCSQSRTSLRLSTTHSST